MKETLSVYEARQYIAQDLQIAVLLIRHKPEHFGPPGSSISKRDFWKVIYVCAGSGILKINNHRYKLFPGFICLVHPDDLTTLELNGEITLYNIIFLRELIAAELKKLYSAYHFFSIFDQEFKPENSLSHNRLHLLDSNRNIYALVKKMAHEYQHQDANSRELLRFQLLELLINLSRLSSKSFTRHRRIEIVRIIDEYLLMHFHEPLSIQRIADELGISRGYLFNLYRKSTGRTIGQKLLQIRLEEAGRLLIETSLTVEELCYRCGFSDLCNFYKVFKREKNCAPGEFRRQHQKQP